MSSKNHEIYMRDRSCFKMNLERIIFGIRVHMWLYKMAEF
jgi:hypothetical protein